ncbi:MAG TPA: FkbM family methyltransferase [Mucilaginibacter sp.]
MKNELLFHKLTERIRINDKGGFACYWRRLPVLYPIILRKMKINREVNVPLFFGDKMNVITGEVVSSILMSFGYSEVALTALMLKLIGPGQSVVDVGTHFGYEALLASRLVGETGKIACFEPNPAVYQLAQKNLNKPNVTVHNAAVGDHEGSVKMLNKPITESAFNSITDSAEDGAIDVALVTLDAVLASREKPIDFIKCDVEGFEMEVLNGCIQILTADKPFLVLEADIPSENEKSTKRAGVIADFLSQYGYEAYAFEMRGAELIIDKLNNLKMSHANVLFVHESKFSAIE